MRTPDVRRRGVAYLQWDKTELRHIAEIARRVPTEGVAAVAKGFWRRGIKDQGSSYSRNTGFLKPGTTLWLGVFCTT